MRGDHPNYCINEIGQNTEKSPGGRLEETCCHSNSSEKTSANAGVKNSQERTNNNNNINNDIHIYIYVYIYIYIYIVMVWNKME